MDGITRKANWLIKIFRTLKLSLYSFQSYITFLLKSTNQHGVHSPFVFDLVTTCFYDKKTVQASNKSKKENLLFRLSSYFEFKNSLKMEDLESKIPDLKSKKYDFIFFNKNQQKETILKNFEILLETTHNDSVFVFDAIYESKNRNDTWETIKQNPKVTVTIDTYYLGFVFFRKEQVKEHFFIRI